MRTPLAWLNVTSNLPRLLLSASGIGFAVVLMFTQIGFLNGLFDSAVEILRLLDADLVILSPARYTVPSEQRFDYGLIERAKSLEGVASATPLYIDRALAEVRVIGHVSRSIRVIGAPRGEPIFKDPEMNRRCQSLTDRAMGLLDRRSKEKYGFEKKDVAKLNHQEIELSGKRIQLIDWLTIGTDFVYDGTLVINKEGVEYFFPMRNGGRPPLAAVDLGLVRVSDRKQSEKVRTELADRLGSSVQVLSHQSLIYREIGFWATNTPIGVIFTIGTVMGLLIGVIICYQILFTDIQDHLAEFATLKAMGYNGSYFFRFVMAQSFYLSLIGFIPGLIISWGLYYVLSEWTGLVMRLTPSRILLVAGLTFLMCAMSGILAVRKLWSADPATLFK
ncbi:MAG: FtsX-like permease family protein [Planctomycetes bacterium]|nr:FtsX-like permease family protein [Planctomycetota bacterium]